MDKLLEAMRAWFLSVAVEVSILILMDKLLED